MAHRISCRAVDSRSGVLPRIMPSVLTISGRCRKRCHNTLLVTAAPTHWANPPKRVTNTSQVRYSPEWLSRAASTIGKEIHNKFSDAKKVVRFRSLFWRKQPTLLGFSHGEEALQKQFKGHRLVCVLLLYLLVWGISTNNNSCFFLHLQQLAYLLHDDSALLLSLFTNL
jgi:hypothetical protein